MRLTTGYENRKARIELINLIDIAFIILIAFVYGAISLTMSKGLKVTLPVGAADPDSRRRIVRIALDSDSTLWLDKEACDLEACVRKAAAAARGGSCSVLISGDRGAELGVGIELLSMLKEAGVDSVAFEVRKR